MVETKRKRPRQVNSKRGTDFRGADFETRYFFDFSSWTFLRKFLRSKYRKAASILSFNRLSSCIFARNFIEEFKHLRFRAYFVLVFGLGAETDDGRLMKAYLAGKFGTESSGDGCQRFGEFFGIEDGIHEYVRIRKIGRNAYGDYRYDAEFIIFSSVPEALEGNLGDACGKVGSNLVGSGTHVGGEITAGYYGRGLPIQLIIWLRTSFSRFTDPRATGIREARFPSRFERGFRAFPFRTPDPRKRVRRGPA